MNLKITQEDAGIILYELSPNESFDEDDKFLLIEKSEWSGGGKYQSCEAIFQKIGEPALYRLTAQRTGSHYTEWYRTYDLNCPRVEKVEKVEVTYHYVDCDPS